VFYVFNRFDDKDSRHQQARGLVQRQCGDRLLTTTICDGIEVEKALASRMTVADWAPKSEVTRDFLALASWVRRAAPVYANERSPELWSER
jgi:cellulose biosynthesis protein BcsQ